MQTSLSASLSALLLLCTNPSLVWGSELGGLIDYPVIGTYRQSLDGFWDVSSSSLASSPIQGSVPGDLVTDLQLAGVIGDPLFGNNFVAPYNISTKQFMPQIWDQANFTYSMEVTPSPSLFEGGGGNDGEILLVFDGIKMASGIWLDGNYLGTTADQFLRYIFPVGRFLSPGRKSVLSVELMPATDPSNAQARFMSASG